MEESVKDDGYGLRKGDGCYCKNFLDESDRCEQNF